MQKAKLLNNNNNSNSKVNISSKSYNYLSQNSKQQKSMIMSFESIFPYYVMRVK
jgi:hypothetical protein